MLKFNYNVFYMDILYLEEAESVVKLMAFSCVFSFVILYYNNQVCVTRGRRSRPSVTLVLSAGAPKARLRGTKKYSLGAL